MASRRPDIVVILADELRRSALGCAGDPNVATPHIDRLAADGVRFANASATYPVCVPSRFTFVTGEYAHSRMVPAIGWRLSPAERTIAHELAAAGYQTAYVGKWHLYGAHPHDAGRRSRNGLKRIPRSHRGGFEWWRAFEFRNEPLDTYYFADDEPTPRRIDGYQTDGLCDLAIEFIQSARDRTRPFFLVLSVEPPHGPHVAPEPYAGRWHDREVRLQPNVDLDALVAESDDPAVRARRVEQFLVDLRQYYAMIENLDDNVGRLLTCLDGEGLSDTTAVMFCSDHGSLWGSHGLNAKQHPYEESVGIPLIYRLPSGGIAGGRVLDDPTCTEDWFPTLRGLAGLAPDAAKPGVDLCPVMRGDVRSVDRPGVLLEFVGEYRQRAPFFGAGWRGFRTKRFKYTVQGGPDGAEPWQLYDLECDPYEQRNLIDDAGHRGIAAELHGHLRDTLVASDDDYVLRPAFGHAALNWPTEAVPVDNRRHQGATR